MVASMILKSDDKDGGLRDDPTNGWEEFDEGFVYRNT